MILLGNWARSRRISSAVCVAMTVAAGACGRDPLDLRCEWAPDAPRSLQADALRAEDVGVRYADVRAGRRSGRRSSPAEYTRVRNLCLSLVFERVAQAHGVSVAEVRAAAAERPRLFDAAVMLSFALLYLAAADRVVRWIRLRFIDSSVAAVVTVGAAATTALGGILLGGVWAAGAEIVRIGNDHLSFRGFRIPWDRHTPELFTAGVALFLAVAIVEWFARRDYDPASKIG